MRWGQAAAVITSSTVGAGSIGASASSPSSRRDVVGASAKLAGDRQPAPRDRRGCAAAAPPALAGGTAVPAAAAARRCARRSASWAAAHACAAPGSAPAGSTTPAARAPAAAATAARNLPGRFSPTACAPAWPPSPPGRPGATMTGTLDLLDHEPPPRRAIERELHIIDTVQLRKPGAQRPTSRRLIRPARDLAVTNLDGQVGDLASMNIKRAYDPHRDLLELHGLERPGCSNTPVPRESP
jgi:hypothetical protein